MSERYNYYEVMYSDIEQYLLNDFNFDDWRGDIDGAREWLYDELFIDDGVTGNASGSYFFNTWKAEEAIAHNLDLLAEALDEFGCSGAYVLEQGAEACDVTIRCYLLYSVLGNVLEDYEAYFEEDEEDEEDDRGEV